LLTELSLAREEFCRKRKLSPEYDKTKIIISILNRVKEKKKLNKYKGRELWKGERMQLQLLQLLQPFKTFSHSTKGKMAATIQLTCLNTRKLKNKFIKKKNYAYLLLPIYRNPFSLTCGGFNSELP
jgi:hypothetical protein